MPLKKRKKLEEAAPKDDGKFHISVQQFLYILNAVKPGLATKDVIEQTTHFIFTGNEVVTWNDRVCVSYPFDCPFNCSVEAKDLIGVLRGMKEKEIDDIYLEDNTLIIEGELTTARLSTLVSERKVEEAVESLNLQDLEWDDVPSDLLQGLALCAFSASNDYTTQNLFCLYVNDSEVWSTDGNRCSIYNMDGTMPHVLIPAVTIPDLIAYEVTAYSFEENWIHFLTKDDATFSIKVSTGDFHDISSYFDVDGDEIDLPEELAEAIDAATAMCEGDTQNDLLAEVTIKKKEILIHAEKERGSISKKVPCSYKGEEIEFSINPVFFSEILKQRAKDGLKTYIDTGVCLFEVGSFRHVLSLPI